MKRTTMPWPARVPFLPALLAGVTVLTVLAGCSDHGDPLVPEDTVPQPDPVSFATEVQPIFDASCVGCHGAGGNGGLDLRAGSSRANLVGVPATGGGGDRVVAGDSAASVLYQKLTGVGGLMPPTGALPAAEVDLVATWIDEGALDN